MKKLTKNVVTKMIDDMKTRTGKFCNPGELVNRLNFNFFDEDGNDFEDKFFRNLMRWGWAEDRGMIIWTRNCPF